MSAMIDMNKYMNQDAFMQQMEHERAKFAILFDEREFYASFERPKRTVQDAYDMSERYDETVRYNETGYRRQP